MKVWRVDHTNSSSATADDSIPAFPCAVTSIAFAPRRIRNKLVLAIGLEDGGISLVIGDPATSGPSAEVRRGNTNGPNGGLAPSPNKMPFAATAGTTGSSWVTLCVVPALDAHVGAVRAMAWRPWRSQIEGGNEGTRSHNGDEREPTAILASDRCSPAGGGDHQPSKSDHAPESDEVERADTELFESVLRQHEVQTPPKHDNRRNEPRSSIAPRVCFSVHDTKHRPARYPVLARIGRGNKRLCSTVTCPISAAPRRTQTRPLSGRDDGLWVHRMCVGLDHR